MQAYSEDDGEPDAVILKNIVDGAVEADTVCVFDPECVQGIKHVSGSLQ